MRYFRRRILLIGAIQRWDATYKRVRVIWVTENELRQALGKIVPAHKKNSIPQVAGICLQGEHAIEQEAPEQQRNHQIERIDHGIRARQRDLEGEQSRYMHRIPTSHIVHALIMRIEACR